MADVKMHQVNADRMNMILEHVVRKGHTLKIRPLGANYVEVECIDSNGTEKCGEGNEPWWDHWDFLED